jgi:hypothetical protein
MNELAATLNDTSFGSGRTYGGLTAFPLVGSSQSPPAYWTLDEAIDRDLVRITEIDSGGSVPELRLRNDADRPVLLLDGEELVGAKQNRALNLTVLAPPGKTIVIPVSCVEQGRWNMQSAAFAVERHVMSPRARKGKAKSVSAALAMASGPRSDQSKVWDDLAVEARVYNARSPSGAMREIYRKRAADLDAYVDAFPPVDGQVGVVFAVHGTVGGVELFDHPDTLRRLLPKVVRSWALEAVGARPEAHDVPSKDSARAFLDAVGGAELRRHEGVGLGRDVRFAEGAIAGGALIHDEGLVHLCAFRTPDDDEDRTSHSRGRLIRRRR